MRIASLLPAATEIACAVGAEKDLIAVSHECDFPRNVIGLPKLTRTRLSPHECFADLHDEVTHTVTAGLSLYEVCTEGLKATKPDIIITQDLCDICAVTSEDVERAVSDLLLRNVRILGLKPERLDDVWNNITLVGTEIGHADEAKARLDNIHHQIQALRARLPKHRPTVLTIEWLDPVMVGGLWMPELVDLAGGEPLITAPGDYAPTLDFSELTKLCPDVVLIKPCGYSLEQSLRATDQIRKALPWDQWAACNEGRVFIADGNSYFNRPGPRLLESLEILAGCTHPKLFADLRQKHRRAVRRLTPDGAIASFV